jgi:predicted dehydrogenase
MLGWEKYGNFGKLTGGQPMATTRFGIIGAGYIVKEFLNNAPFAPSVQPVAIASRTYAKAAELAAAHHIPNVYHTVDELLAADVDAIYVATQNDTHYAYAAQALEAGKHVLLEKPACVNQAQLAKLLQLADAKGLKLMEAMRFIHTPAYIELKRLLASGDFGSVISVEGSLGKISQRTYRHTLELCGGATLDLGIYPITAVIDLLGYPYSICSAAVKNAAGVDSSMNAIFQYNRGQLANVGGSFTSLTRGDLRICTNICTLTLPAYFTTASTIIITQPDGSQDERKFEAKGTEMCHEMEYFCKASRQDMNHALTMNVVKALDTIRAQQGIRFAGEA